MAIYFEDVTVGQQLPEIVEQFNNIALVMWEATIWHFHRIHWDQEFARKADAPGPLVHGQMHGHMLSEMLMRWVQPEGRIRRVKWKNRVMTTPEDTLTFGGSVSRKYQEDGRNMVECELWIKNAEGRTTTPGSAEVELPSRSG
jgi:acyl dehydratase